MLSLSLSLFDLLFIFYTLILQLCCSTRISPFHCYRRCYINGKAYEMLLSVIKIMVIVDDLIVMPFSRQLRYHLSNHTWPNTYLDLFNTYNSRIIPFLM